MSSDDQVVPTKGVGFITWIFKILGFPFTVGNILYTMLVKRNLRNCLPGKVVLITGASSGLGEALAHTFYIAGCKVVLAARRQDELERVRKDLLQLHSVSKANDDDGIKSDDETNLITDTHDASANCPSS